MTAALVVLGLVTLVVLALAIYPVVLTWIGYRNPSRSAYLQKAHPHACILSGRALWALTGVIATWATLAGGSRGPGAALLEKLLEP